MFISRRNACRMGFPGYLFGNISHRSSLNQFSRERSPFNDYFLPNLDLYLLKFILFLSWFPYRETFSCTNIIERLFFWRVREGAGVKSKYAWVIKADLTKFRHPQLTQSSSTRVEWSLEDKVLPIVVISTTYIFQSIENLRLFFAERRVKADNRL